MSSRKPTDPASAAPPDADESTIRIGDAPTVAGGLKAVGSAFAHMKRAGHGPLRTLAILRRMNQTDGFDCPGCAWPDPDEKRSFLAEYCENGAKAIAEESVTRRADAEFFARHSIEELRSWTDFELSQAGRLTEPLVRRPGGTHYEPIAWDDAFAAFGASLATCENPDRAVFYTSGRTSNEAAFLYQLMVRRFGTNNLPDCSNMCHESSGVGLGETLGIGKGSVTLKDFEHTDLIVVMGQNPGTNHPRMLTALSDAKARGATIIAINPLPEPGLQRFSHPQRPMDLLRGGRALCDHFLQVRVGEDIALLNAIMCELVSMDDARPGSAIDHEFVRAKTSGYDEWLASLRTMDARKLSERAGVAHDDVVTVANVIAAKPNMIICWAMGITQHVHGVANVEAIVNLILLRGAIGKPGAGTCPVRGHSNVQGDRTVGIHERPSSALLDAIESRFGFAPPRADGWSVVESIAAMESGHADVFVAMGGNMLSAAPEPDRVAAGLSRCAMTTYVSTKLNRTHLFHGETSLILPCLGRSESDEQAGGTQFVTVENSMGIVHQSRGDRTPASTALRSEPSIVASMATAMESAGAMPAIDEMSWAPLADNYDRIRDLIESVIPGFGDYNARVRKPGGFALPNPPRTGTFATPDARAHFTAVPNPDHALPADTIRLMTIRSHDQFNTTIYGLDDRYRGIHGGRRVIFMHPDDIAGVGLAEGDHVDIESIFPDRTRRITDFRVVAFDIARGCAAAYFPEANPLVPVEHAAHRSHTPASKLIPIRVHARSR